MNFFFNHFHEIDSYLKNKPFNEHADCLLSARRLKWKDTERKKEGVL